MTARARPPPTHRSGIQPAAYRAHPRIRCPSRHPLPESMPRMPQTTAAAVRRVRMPAPEPRHPLLPRIRCPFRHPRPKTGRSAYRKRPREPTSAAATGPETRPPPHPLPFPASATRIDAADAANYRGSGATSPDAGPRAAAPLRPDRCPFRHPRPKVSAAIPKRPRERTGAAATGPETRPPPHPLPSRHPLPNRCRGCRKRPR